MTSINDFNHSPYALPLARLGEFFPWYRWVGPEPPPSSKKYLDQWSLEEDDKPILQYIYKAHQSKRHLEFGTWQGWGAALCLESCCEANVWTINLSDGEDRPDGTWAYSQRVNSPQDFEGILGNLPNPRIVRKNFGEDELGPRNYHKTDAGDYIGHIYREKGLEDRVCQVFCDSRLWDNSMFPNDFFDSVLIDGGHLPEVVINDTRKALQVLRPGGLIMWHDFCPQLPIRSQFASVKGVTAGIEQIVTELQEQLEMICWINPSWILVGRKNPKKSWIKHLTEKIPPQYKPV